MRSNRSLMRRLCAFALLLLSTGSPVLASAQTPSFQLVSAADPALGPPAGGGGDSSLPTVSRDGRYVLFASTANNLVVLGTNRPLPALFPAPLNVFLRDRTKGSTALVSINLQGTGGGNADSWPIGISTNGRFALFESGATNLVLNDTNNAPDVFVRDLVAGTTTLVSVATNGAAADGSSYSSTMTPDGRYVAFSSAADNLVAGDTNAIPDIFVRDLVTQTTSLASVGAQPASSPLANVGSDNPLLTPDGRYVAFYSTATNLVPGTVPAGNLYLRDRVLGSTAWVSRGAMAALATLAPVTNSVSFNHALSDDGRFVAFEAVPFPKNSPAVILRFDLQTGLTDLIETNAWLSLGSGYETFQDLAMTPDGRFVAYAANALGTAGTTTAIQLWDAQAGATTPVSANPTNGISTGASSDWPAISDNGRFVAFISSAPDLVTNQVPGEYHVYLRDMANGLTILIDADTNGVGSAADSSSVPALTADGGFVAFSSGDGNIVPADRNRAYDVFGRDTARGVSELISAHAPTLASLTPDGTSSLSLSSASADARLVAFWSEADDLVANDTNGLRDVYVRDLLAGTNLLVSVALGGSSANGVSTEPAISGDGRLVAFSSFADNLVNGDSNKFEDVFVRDLQANTTRLVSLNSAGTGPGDKDSYSPLISSNGQFVLFRSHAGNLVRGMVSGTENLFWRDLGNSTTYALTTNGVTAAAMTPDGSRVAFITSTSKTSPASDQLAVWDSQSKSVVYSSSAGGFPSSYSAIALSADGQRLAWIWNSIGPGQIYVSDLAGTNPVLVARQPTPAPDLHLSANGRFLAYLSAPMTTRPVFTQVYLYDSQTATNVLVTAGYDGVSTGDDNSDSVSLSADGRFVAYRSAAANLVPGDNNGVPDIFLYDRLSGGTTLITADLFGNGSADNRSLTPVLSQDGRTLLLTSWASDLTPYDFNSNADIFSVGLYAPGGIPDFSVNVLPAGDTAAARLTWRVVAGKSYRLQFKNALSDSIWRDLSEPIAIVNGVASAPANSAGTGFYRVVAY